MISKEKIASILYEEVDYMYCNNCRYKSEIDNKEDSCEWCYRKYNGWGISMKEAERLAELISEVE